MEALALPYPRRLALRRRVCRQVMLPSSSSSTRPLIVVRAAYVSREDHEHHADQARDQDADALAVVHIDRKKPVVYGNALGPLGPLR